MRWGCGVGGWWRGIRDETVGEVGARYVAEIVKCEISLGSVVLVVHEKIPCHLVCENWLT